LPRFYFDVSVGDDFTHDDVGFEYESLEVAEYYATRTAAEVSQDALSKGHNTVVRVRDGDGFLLLTVEVSLTLRRTARALACDNHPRVARSPLYGMGSKPPQS